MLTLGSQQREIDFEPEWRKKMKAFQDPALATQKVKGVHSHTDRGLLCQALQLQCSQFIIDITHNVCIFMQQNCNLSCSAKCFPFSQH